MKKVLAGLACVAIFIFSGVAHAYTVKVVNCSDRNIIVTVAASYLVTAQDHLTIAVDPHKINTGSMGGLLSAGYRVAVDRSCPTQYNRSNFTHGCGFAVHSSFAFNRITPMVV